MNNSIFDLQKTLFSHINKFSKKTKDNKVTSFLQKYLSVAKNPHGKKVFFIIILSFVILLSINIGVKEYKEYKFTKTMEDLSNKEVKTIEVPLISEKDIKDLCPSDNTSSVYENKNFYMFQLYDNKNIDKYNVSAYIQKPNNVINFVHTGSYGNINTDTFSINLTINEAKENSAELLHVQKASSIERLDDFLINNIKFQSYVINKNDGTTDYFLISEGFDGYCLVYNLYSTNGNLPVLNYLSYVVIS